MYNLFINVINYLINAIVVFANLILSILPDSPFNTINAYLDSTWIGYINWLIPFKEMFIFTGVWISCIAIYYSISAVLRKIEAIE